MTGAESDLAPLMYLSRVSTGTRDQLQNLSECPILTELVRNVQLLDVDGGGPVVVAEEVEV